MLNNFNNHKKSYLFFFYFNAIKRHYQHSACGRQNHVILGLSYLTLLTGATFLSCRVKPSLSYEDNFILLSTNPILFSELAILRKRMIANETKRTNDDEAAEKKTGTKFC